MIKQLIKLTRFSRCFVLLTSVHLKKLKKKEKTTVSHDINVNWRTVSYSHSMDVALNVSTGTFITLSQIRVNILSCFICFVYVKAPRCRNEDIDQNVPETSYNNEN